MTAPTATVAHSPTDMSDPSAMDMGIRNMLATECSKPMATKAAPHARGLGVSKKRTGGVPQSPGTCVYGCMMPCWGRAGSKGVL